MRALVYTRVSKDRRHGRSVAEQEAECRDLCAREGWTVVDVLTDNDRSASRHATKVRPAWTAAKETIRSGDVDVLVTWEASRAQRDLDAYTELRSLCAEAGVRWSYGGGVYDLADHADRFRTGMDALVAENEADRTRDRVLRALRSNAAKGRPHGRRPYGYRRTFDPHTGAPRQEIDPVEAAVLRDAAARVLAGESTHAIAAGLRTAGVPTMLGGQWDGSSIRRMLTNPAIAGIRTHLGAVVADADWPAIIDTDTRARLVAVLTDPARRTHRQTETLHLLTPCLRCGVCTGRMTVGRTRGAGSAPTYRCRTSSHVTRNVAVLDEHMTDLIVDRLSRPDAVADLEQLEHAGPDVDAEVIDLRDRLDQAVAAFHNRELSATMLGRIEADVIPLLQAAERRRRSSAMVPPAVYAIAGAADTRAAWDAEPASSRRAIAGFLVTVTVHPASRRGPNSFDPADIATRWVWDT